MTPQTNTLVSPSQLTEKPDIIVGDDKDANGHGALHAIQPGANHQGPVAFTLLILSVCLAAFIVALDRSIVATAIPRITDDFRSPSDVGWYGSAYLLTSCAFQPIYGRVYAHFDVRNAYLVAFAFFELGSVICGAAPTSTALIVGRAIAGIGCAGILAGNLNIISLSAPLEKRPLYLGLVGSMYVLWAWEMCSIILLIRILRTRFGVGSVCGPVIGGALTNSVTWRWCFYINLPVGAVTLAILLFFFRPQKATGDIETIQKRLLHLDLLGNLLIVTTTVMLLLALQWGGVTYAWKSPTVIGLLVGFGLTAVLFVAWQKYHGTQALLPLHIVTQRTVAASILSSFFLSAAVLVYSYYLPYWFQTIRKATPLASGVDLIPYVAANFLFAMIAGIAVTKTGYFNPPVLIGPVIGTVGAGLLSTLQVNTPTAKWVGFEILGAAGVGAAVQQYFLAIQTVLAPDEIPIGTALVLFAQNLGGAIFVSVGSSLIRNKLSASLSQAQFSAVDIRVILTAGATDVRGLVKPSQLGLLVHVYNNALRAVFIMAIPLTALASLCALPMRWKNLKAQQGPDGNEER